MRSVSGHSQADGGPGGGDDGLLDEEGGQLAHAALLVAVDGAVDVEQHRVDAVAVQTQLGGADGVG